MAVGSARWVPTCPTRLHVSEVGQYFVYCPYTLIHSACTSCGSLWFVRVASQSNAMQGGTTSLPLRGRSYPAVIPLDDGSPGGAKREAYRQHRASDPPPFAFCLLTKADPTSIHCFRLKVECHHTDYPVFSAWSRQQRD